MAKLIKSPLGTDILVYTPKEWERGLKNDYYLLKGEILYEKNQELIKA